MPRDFFINGESLVLVKGNVSSGIANLSELCLTDTPIGIRFETNYMDINVDAWGEAPADVQYKLGGVRITMSAVHVDTSVLQICLAESQGGAAGPGISTRAGTRLGGNSPRFLGNNHYIGLNIASPVGGLPYCFQYCYLQDNPISWPLGTERSTITLNWRCVPYTQDPWTGGLGAAGNVLWSRILDT